MKLLTAFILAAALMFRAAPICAAPVQTEAAAPMLDCGDAARHHDGKPDQQKDDATRACHSCVFPPVVEPNLTRPEPIAAVAAIPTIGQLSGGGIEPPTPPPRTAARTAFQHSIGVTS